MENLHVPSFENYLLEAKMPDRLDKRSFAKINKEIIKLGESVKAFNGEFKGYFLDMPITKSNIYFDDIVFGVYYSPKKTKWVEMVIKFQSNKKASIVYRDVTSIRANKLISKAAFSSPKLKKTDFKKVAAGVQKFAEEGIAKKAVKAKKATSNILKNVPDSDNTSGVFKFLNAHFSKSKSITIRQSKTVEGGVIFYHRYSFNPTIAKFPVEEIDDFMINLNSMSINTWDRYDYNEGDIVEKIDSIKKLPAQLRKLARDRRAQTIKDFNNSPANDWKY